MASVRVSLTPEASVYQVTFNPQDNTNLCATGDGVFKLFRYTEGTLRQLAPPKMDPLNCLCQAWLSESRIIVGTDASKVILFEGGELKAEFKVFDKAEDMRVECVTAHSTGFVCGGALGTLHRFEAVEDKELYKKVGDEKTPNDTNGAQVIRNLAISPSEDNMVCTTDVSQLYTLRLAPEDADTQKTEGPALKLLSQPFHHDSIKGLSIATRKPLVATCSADCSIRIWNYLDNTVELMKYFPEEALSIALHPSGLFVLVGFTDKLRLLNLLIDDIRPFKDFPIRNCRECSFANGGHKFAAANGPSIEIYSTYTFEVVGHLKGHNQKVTSIIWSSDDTKIVSCGKDGAVYEWDAQTYERTGENVLKSCSYSCVATTPDAKTLFAVGSDKTLKEISDNTIVHEVPSHNKQHPVETVLGQIVMSSSGKTMLVGTEKGAIRSVKFPLSAPWEGSSNPSHFGPVNKMRVSNDDEFLFSVGDDGCLFTYKIREKDIRGGHKAKEAVWADEILITKSDLEEKNQTLDEKKTEVEELKMSNEYQMRLKEMNYKDQLKELQAKFEQDIETLNVRLHMLQGEKDREESRHDTEVTDVKELQDRSLQEKENAHNQKLLDQYEKYEKLQRKSQEMQERCERQLDELEKEKTRALEDLAEFWENKLLEKSGQLDAANDEKRESEREHLEIRRQIELDADREILSIKNQYERTLKDERETSLRLKGDNGILQKKFKSMVLEIEEQKATKLEMETEQKKLHAHIRALEKEILSGKKDCEERDETIQDKEKRIYDLKKKNQELEKFKFVLDYKIRELKKQIEPRENDIKQMKVQITKMDEELAQYYKSNTDLQLQIEQMKLQLDASDTERRKSDQKAAHLQNRLTRFQADLHMTAALATEPAKLVGSVKDLYKQYCEEGGNFTTTIEEDIQHEHNRQREFLERSVAGLRGKLNRTSQMAAEDTSRVMHENVVLIGEINELRRELELAHLNGRKLESALAHTSKLSAMRGLSVPGLDQLSGDTEGDGGAAQNLERIVDLQKTEIRKLRSAMSSLESTQRDRPPSQGQRLEPLVA
jgi:WD40 repeat protein